MSEYSRNGTQSRARRRPESVANSRVSYKSSAESSGNTLRNSTASRISTDKNARSSTYRSGVSINANAEKYSEKNSESYLSNQRHHERSVNNGYSFTVGKSAAARNSGRTMTGARRVDGERRNMSMTLKENKKLERQKKRELVEEHRENEWQKNIVRVKGGIDIPMLIIIIALIALGSITVFSASYPYALAKGYESNTYIKSQIQFVIIGAVFMTLMTVFPIKWYKSWAPLVAYGVSAVLLIAVLFIGTEEGVTMRWIDFGFFNVQPSELMKVSIILTLAWYMDKYEEKMADQRLGRGRYWWNTFFPLAILGCACLLVLVGKHLSGTVIVGLIGFSMLVVGGCKMSWLLKTAIPVGIVAVSAFLLMNSYALERITTFTDENADKLDELYQTTQSIYAIGSGGLFGVGIGASRQKFSYLTAAHTDFIFSVWCEELGFIGAIGLILLFLLFIWRGYVIAQRAPDKFTMLTAFGITTHVGLQAFLNMCVASDMIPNTGITLPFFSYGGSSLVVLMIEMGVLLAISKQFYRKKSDIERDALMRDAGL